VLTHRYRRSSFSDLADVVAATDCTLFGTGRLGTAMKRAWVRSHDHAAFATEWEEDAAADRAMGSAAIVQYLAGDGAPREEDEDPRRGFRLPGNGVDDHEDRDDEAGEEQEALAAALPGACAHARVCVWGGGGGQVSHFDDISTAS
jgi:hypothetical protein